MASAKAGWRKRILRRIAPFLFKQCPEGNWHYHWHQLCWCRVDEHSGDWHGGVYVFATEEELCRDMQVDRLKNIAYQKGYQDGVAGLEGKIKKSIFRTVEQRSKKETPKPT